MNGWLKDALRPQTVLTVAALLGALAFGWANMQAHCENTMIHPTPAALAATFETQEQADERFDRVREDLGEIKQELRDIKAALRQR